VLFVALKEAASIEENRQKKEADIYGKITFAPTIDPLSKALGRRTGDVTNMLFIVINILIQCY